MKLITLFLFYFLVFISQQSWSQSNNCNTSDKKVNKALEVAINSASFEDQVKGLAAVISKYPDNVQAYFYLGRIHYQQGMVLLPKNRTEAEKLLQRAASLVQDKTGEMPALAVREGETIFELKKSNSLK